jgi:hypothetical protein
MLRLHAYDFEHPAVGTNACLISAECAQRSRYLAVRNEENSHTFIAVACSSCSTVAPADIVLHPWTFDALRIDKANSVVVTPLEIDSVTTRIVLRFECFQSLKHWDEVTSVDGLFYLPNMWYTCWPRDVKSPVLEAVCELVLLGNVLCDGASVSLRYLDYIVVSTKFPSMLYTQLQQWADVAALLSALKCAWMGTEGQLWAASTANTASLWIVGRLQQQSATASLRWLYPSLSASNRPSAV